MNKRFLSALLCLFFLISGLNAKEKIRIYVPATPSSIPVIIAAENLNDVKVTVFTNHSQANALFLKGDIEMLSTGLSLGMNFYKNKAPVQIINSYVAGLTYMVSYEKPAADFNDIKVKEIYIPFQGSPIEEITNFLIGREGLKQDDFKFIYSQFPSSIELLKKGKALYVPLPEPYVSLLEKEEKIIINFSYQDLWEKAAGKKNGYPQVGTFVKSEWAVKNKAFIRKFNKELEAALLLIKNDPGKAADKTASYFDFKGDILKNSLKRTEFYLIVSGDLKKEILDYYQIIGKPLDESFKEFFYIY